MIIQFPFFAGTIIEILAPQSVNVRIIGYCGLLILAHNQKMYYNVRIIIK